MICCLKKNCFILFVNNFVNYAYINAALLFYWIFYNKRFEYTSYMFSCFIIVVSQKFALLSEKLILYYLSIFYQLIALLSDYQQQWFLFNNSDSVHLLSCSMIGLANMYNDNETAVHVWIIFKTLIIKSSVEQANFRRTKFNCEKSLSNRDNRYFVE